MRQRAIDRYKPYSKQLEFHAAGGQYDERLFMAGNQLGKSLAGAAEMAYHATGQYPPYWQGHRFDAGIMAWAAGESWIETRDTVQTRLVGPPELAEQWGTGMIPHDAIVGISRRTQPANAIDAVVVRHVSGSYSTVRFKAYDQGRRRWQGPPIDAVWLDEEPPLDIYREAITRTNATAGITFITFTPLRGISDVVRLFLSESDVQAMLEIKTAEREAA